MIEEGRVTWPNAQEGTENERAIVAKLHAVSGTAQCLAHRLANMTCGYKRADFDALRTQLRCQLAELDELGLDHI